MITNQVHLFFIFILNGVIIGLLFDFFRILRKSFKTTDLITYIEDILFWILTGITILYSVFLFNNGEIRIFMFLGIALGIVLYIVFVSKYVIKINVTIITFIKKIIIKIFKILGIPLKCILKILKKVFFRPISFIIINLRKNSTKAFKNILQKSNSNKKNENNTKNLKYKKEF